MDVNICAMLAHRRVVNLLAAKRKSIINENQSICMEFEKKNCAKRAFDALSLSLSLFSLPPFPPFPLRAYTIFITNNSLASLGFFSFSNH